MPLRTVTNRLFPITAAVLVSLTLTACGSDMSLTQSRARGYEISEDAVAQIRVGQSAALVTAVLGSPQVTNSFATETAWYYLGEKVQQTAFGMELSKERKLTRAEDRELRELIELVDRLSFWRIANALSHYWHETLHPTREKGRDGRRRVTRGD